MLARCQLPRLVHSRQISDMTSRAAFRRNCAADKLDLEEIIFPTCNAPNARTGRHCVDLSDGNVMSRRTTTNDHVPHKAQQSFTHSPRAVSFPAQISIVYSTYAVSQPSPRRQCGLLRWCACAIVHKAALQIAAGMTMQALNARCWD